MRTAIRNILLQESAPAPIIALLNPAMWLDCSSPNTIASTGGKLTQWSDKTTNENNATPPAVADRPDYGLVSLNGYPLVTCNGFPSIGLSTPLVLTGDYTIILVARQANSGASRIIQSALGNNCVISPSRSVNAFYLQTADYASPAVVPLNTYGITATVIGTTAPQLWYRGVNYGVGNITGDWGQLTIGAVGAFPEDANCDIAEIIAFNYRLSPAQVAAVDAELTAKWGI